MAELGLLCGGRLEPSTYFFNVSQLERCAPQFHMFVLVVCMLKHLQSIYVHLSTYWKTFAEYLLHITIVTIQGHALDSNVCAVHATAAESMLQLGVQRLRNELMLWYATYGGNRNLYELTELTPAMLGPSSDNRHLSSRLQIHNGQVCSHIGRQIRSFV